MFLEIVSSKASISAFGIFTGFGVLSSLHLRASASPVISSEIAVDFWSSVPHFLSFPSLSIRDTSSIARASCGLLTSSSFLKSHGFVSITSPVTFCFSLIPISDSLGRAISSACLRNPISACDVSFLVCFARLGTRDSACCTIEDHAPLAIGFTFHKKDTGAREPTFIAHSIASAKLGLDCRTHSHHFPTSSTFCVCPVFSITFCTTGESAAPIGSKAVHTTSHAYEGTPVNILLDMGVVDSLSVVCCTSPILFAKPHTSRSLKLGDTVSFPLFLSSSRPDIISCSQYP
jgi:hypothetical protein